MSKISPAELREFKRYALEFEVDVYAILNEAKVLVERAVLKDVSGGGMCFLSKRSSLYFVGQRVLLHVCMPATDEQDIGMECMSRVVWIHQMQHSGAGEQQQAVIGVSIDKMLSLEENMHDQDSGERP